MRLAIAFQIFLIVKTERCGREGFKIEKPQVKIIEVCEAIKACRKPEKLIRLLKWTCEVLYAFENSTNEDSGKEFFLI